MSSNGPITGSVYHDTTTVKSMDDDIFVGPSHDDHGRVC